MSKKKEPPAPGEPRFFNRELSWVEFNGRVLDQAEDGETPLLERLKFLAIYANNLDEFFMIRVAGVHSQVVNGLEGRGPSGLTPRRVLAELEEGLARQADRLYRNFKELSRELHDKRGFALRDISDLSEEDVPRLKRIFKEEYESLLTPMGMDQSRPFPFTKGKSLFIFLRISSEDGTKEHHAVIPVPAMNRLIKIPHRPGQYLLLEDLIRLFADRLFHGYSVAESAVFRVTRDADLDIAEEEVADLLSALESQLKQRERGDAIRLELTSDVSPEAAEILKENLGMMDSPFVFIPDGPLDLTFLFGLNPAVLASEAPLPSAGKAPREPLTDEPMPPLLPSWFPEDRDAGELFSLISEKDRWIHLPFHSFEPVTALIEEAAADPRVLALKMTLYRTSGRSRIVSALKKAADAGKQVTVLVELKARFDEAQNINWAKELERAGCHVVYGLVGMKIHAKMTLIIRRGDEGIERFVHLGTGNYNEKTAALYTDIGFFTARKRYGKEVGEIFNVLTGFSEPPRWKTLICSPLDLRDFTLSLVDREMENVKAGGEGRIWAKMNSLIDIKVITKLYEASQAGVKIQLLVRGMCRLVPGVPGLSENIRVTSVVGRFLEHSRVYRFYNQGKEDLYLSSADWMERNLDRRIEVLFPIKDAEMRAEIIRHMTVYEEDNKNTYILLSDGVYHKKEPAPEEKSLWAQKEIYAILKDKEAEARKERRSFRLAGKEGEKL